MQGSGQAAVPATSLGRVRLSWGNCHGSQVSPSPGAARGHSLPWMAAINLPQGPPATAQWKEAGERSIFRRSVGVHVLE